jgi:hypothetical protein
MAILPILLLALALASFIIAALRQTPTPVNFGWIGAAILTIYLMILKAG